MEQDESKLKAEEYKKLGNEEFKAGNHLKATDHYSKAIGNAFD